MAIKITRFTEETASPSHEGTILASPVFSDGFTPPFGHAYGYLANGGEMDAHAHPTEEVYIILSGTGTITVGHEEAAVGPGDVIEIPPDQRHTIKSQPGCPLLWAAFWWKTPG